MNAERETMIKTDIILAGVGGQGILSIAAVIGLAAMKQGLNLKQAEVHGMSQRGGSVQSHLRLSDKPISSDLIPKGEASLIISLEPMESLRYLPYLKPTGWIVSNSSPFINIDTYPPVELIIKEIEMLDNHVLIDAEKIARDVGSIRTSNMVILGAASRFIDIPEDMFTQGIMDLFKKKGDDIVQLNINAFIAGKNNNNKR